jgi:hypothetical protein
MPGGVRELSEGFLVGMRQSKWRRCSAMRRIMWEEVAMVESREKTHFVSVAPTGATLTPKGGAVLFSMDSCGIFTCAQELCRINL